MWEIDFQNTICVVCTFLSAFCFDKERYFFSTIIFLLHLISPTDSTDFTNLNAWEWNLFVESVLSLGLFHKGEVFKNCRVVMIITTDLLFAKNLPGFENLEGLKVKENQS